MSGSASYAARKSDTAIISPPGRGRSKASAGGGPGCPVLLAHAIPGYRAPASRLADPGAGAGNALGSLAVRHRADRRPGAVRGVRAAPSHTDAVDAARRRGRRRGGARPRAGAGPGDLDHGAGGQRGAGHGDRRDPEPAARPAQPDPGRPVRRGCPARVGRLPARLLGRGERARPDRHGDPARHSAHHRLLRALLSAGRSRRGPGAASGRSSRSPPRTRRSFASASATSPSRR